jgi:hypothetical protein
VYYIDYYKVGVVGCIIVCIILCMIIVNFSVIVNHIVYYIVYHYIIQLHCVLYGGGGVYHIMLLYNILCIIRCVL